MEKRAKQIREMVLIDTQLSNLIYKAVYSAVKHAWEDDSE